MDENEKKDNLVKKEMKRKLSWWEILLGSCVVGFLLYQSIKDAGIQ